MIGNGGIIGKINTTSTTESVGQFCLKEQFDRKVANVWHVPAASYVVVHSDTYYVANGSSVTIGLGAWQVGDTAVVVISRQGDVDIPTNTGWTWLAEDFHSSNTTGRMETFYKVLTASNDLVFSLGSTTEGFATVIVARGLNTTLGTPTAIVNNPTSLSTSVSVESLTSNATKQLVLVNIVSLDFVTGGITARPTIGGSSDWTDEDSYTSSGFESYLLSLRGAGNITSGNKTFTIANVPDFRTNYYLTSMTYITYET